MCPDKDRKDEAGASGGLAGRVCPTCGKPASSTDRPFCSKRCADIDLHRWLSGAYAIPARPDNGEDDESIAGDQAESEEI